MNTTMRNAGMLIAAAAAVALFSIPSPTPWNPYEISMGERLLPPGTEHWLGTDHLGRDLLARIIAGARPTIGIGLAVLLVSIAIGVPLGLLSGMKGGRTDSIFKPIIDGFMTFPDYLSAIILSALLGPGLMSMLIAVIAVKWVRYARLARSVALAEKEKDYAAMALLSGLSPVRLVLKHILPHAMGHVAALAAADLGKIILLMASLSYLGLGSQPPAPEWGSMLSEGRAYFHAAPHLMLAPGLAVMASVLLAGFAGNRLRDRYDVKLKGGAE